MVNEIARFSTSGGGGGDSTDRFSGGTSVTRHRPDPTRVEFELAASNSGFVFAPYYYPRKVEIGKEREVSEQSAICEGEDVNDMGSKNRTASVRGYIRQWELRDYHRLCDAGEEFELISLPWSGEVLLKKTDLEGPIAIDTETGDWLYIYTLELKSTGKDEYSPTDHGIISRGYLDGWNQEERNDLAAEGTMVGL